jgi:hypothetical protein
MYEPDLARVLAHKSARRQILNSLAGEWFLMPTVWNQPYEQLPGWLQRIAPEPVYSGEPWTPALAWSPFGANQHGHSAVFWNGGTNYDPSRHPPEDSVYGREVLEVRNLSGADANLVVELEGGSSVHSFTCPAGMITRIGELLGWHGYGNRLRFWPTSSPAHIEFRIVRVQLAQGTPFQRYRPIPSVQTAA